MKSAVLQVAGQHYCLLLATSKETGLSRESTLSPSRITVKKEMGSLDLLAICANFARSWQQAVCALTESVCAWHRLMQGSHKERR
jgi:hypothetical protein